MSTQTIFNYLTYHDYDSINDYISDLETSERSSCIENCLRKILDYMRNFIVDISEYVDYLKYFIENYYDLIDFKHSILDILEFFCINDNIEVVVYLVSMFPDMDLCYDNAKLFYHSQSHDIKKILYDIIGPKVFDFFSFKKLSFNKFEEFMYYCDLGLLDVITIRELQEEIIHYCFGYDIDIYKYLLDHDPSILGSINFELYCYRICNNVDFATKFRDDYFECISDKNMAILIKHICRFNNYDTLIYICEKYNYIINIINMNELFYECCNSRNMNLDIIKLLIEIYPEVDIKRENIAIQNAIRCNNVEIALYLLDSYYSYNNYNSSLIFNFFAINSF